MSRIKNKNIYPVKLFPKLTDYVVGSDDERSGKTVNFEIGTLSSVLSGAGLPNGIISGTYQWVVGTLTFNFSTIVYRIDGIIYSTDPVTITLNNGGLLDRKDVIAVTTDREVIVIEGVESNDPAKPVLTDATTQLEFTFVDIAAGATVPTGVSKEIIYDEGVGQPAEYNATENTNNTSIQINNTDNPSNGVNGIKIDSPSGDIDFGGDKLSFITNTPVTVNPQDFLQFKIYLDEEFFTEGNKKGLKFLIYNGATLVSNSVTVSDGVFNFNSSLSGEYQIISIPLNVFSFTDTEFNRIDILPNKFYTSGVIYIDEVERVIGLNGADTQLTNHSDLFLDDGTNPHGTTQSDVGLGNVDNTSDLNKPISIATQAALDLKADISSLATVAFSGDYNDLLNLPTINNDVDYVSNVQLVGTNLQFTGVGNAFSSIVDLSSFLTSETDPIFSTHTTSDITNGIGFLKNDGAGNWSYDNNSYSLSSHNHTLDSLSNVTITANSVGEIIKWDGAAWINNTLAEAGIASSSSLVIPNTEVVFGTGTGITSSTSLTWDGFGLLALGTIAASGSLFGSSLSLTGSNPKIVGNDVDGILSIYPSTALDSGSQINMYGETHATKANDIEFLSNGIIKGSWDDSATKWSFIGNLEATSFIKTGGLSTQFLKADGSVDSNTYLTSFTETDPVFSASPAGGILSGDIINWNNAFGWGNHASAGYALDSAVVHKAGTETITGSKTFSEIISASKNIMFDATSEYASTVKAGIGFTSTNRFYFGNPTNINAFKGYFDFLSLTANRTYTYPNASGTVALTSDITSSIQDWLRADVADIKTVGDLVFNDNIKLSFGTLAGESSLYSNATNTLFDLISGDLLFRDNTTTRFTFGRTTGNLTNTGTITSQGTGTSSFEGILKVGNRIETYRPINDGNPSISLGSSSSERLLISALYATGTQELNVVDFKTQTGSAVGDRGLIRFYVDDSEILRLKDAGVDLTGNLVNTGVITSQGTGNSSFASKLTSTYLVASTISSNTAMSVNSAECSGYGLMGNRSAFYITNNDVAGTIKFGIGAVHGSSVLMTLNPSGNVSIGNTNNTYKLDVSGTGRFTGDHTANDHINTSDERKKKDIKSYKVKPIDVNWFNFKWKEGDGSEQLGTIAQDLEIRHPEFVVTNAEGEKAVRYNQLLIAKVAELEEESKYLKSRLELIEQKLGL